MEMEFRIKEPVFGMRVVTKKSKCGCIGLQEDEEGFISSIEPNGLEFTAKSCFGDNKCCVQCVSEVREVSKEEWTAMCDADKSKPKRRT